MSGAACARAAADLTDVSERLGRTARVLEQEATVPADAFGGLSGEAYRRHVRRSADDAVGLAADVALLAGALAGLGRDLDRVAELRRNGHPGDVARAAEVEARAQDDWREALARFLGQVPPAPAVPVPAQPVVGGLSLVPDHEPGPPAPPPAASADDPPPSPTATTAATAGPTCPSATPAGSAVPPASSAAPPPPDLEAAFVVPGLPAGLDAEFVTPRGGGDDG